MADDPDDVGDYDWFARKGFDLPSLNLHDGEVLEIAGLDGFDRASRENHFDGVELVPPISTVVAKSGIIRGLEVCQPDHLHDQRLPLALQLDDMGDGARSHLLGHG
uniref:Uncharacterized protein n=1 Tax=Hemiselmis tepida TaxID=464990 RepID=A0A7S0W9D1_9CRYP